MPLLLANALRTYGIANRRALQAAGFNDIPRAGAQIIGRLEHAGATVGEVGGAFGATMQASRIIETLIERGYVQRLTDADDPNPVNIALTERGSAAAGVIRAAVNQVDAALRETTATRDVDHARTILTALAAQSHPSEEPAQPSERKSGGRRTTRPRPTRVVVFADAYPSAP